MRGMRRKKLQAIFRELVSRGLAPADDPLSNQPKHNFRLFKKLYKAGTLDAVFPTM